jgi:hypothetical protein
MPLKARQTAAEIAKASETGKTPSHVGEEHRLFQADRHESSARMTPRNSAKPFNRPM